MDSSKQLSDGRPATAEVADKVELKSDTLLAYEQHIASLDTDVEQSEPGDQRFLWADACPEKMAELRKGTIIAELYFGKRPVQVPDGLIHDWIGAVFIPGATIERTLAVVQDYDNHKNTYQPEVIASKLIGRQGNDFQICLRLRKRKIITVILDTYHDVRYFSVNPRRWVCTHVPVEFLKWKMRANLRREGGLPIPGTDFCGGSLLTGDSPKATTARL